MAEKRKNNVGLNTLKPGEKGRIAGMALGKGIGEKLQDMGFLQQVKTYARKARYVDQSFYRYRQDRENASSKELDGLFYYEKEFH